MLSVSVSLSILLIGSCSGTRVKHASGAVVSGRVYDATKRKTLAGVRVFVDGVLVCENDRDGGFQIRLNEDTTHKLSFRCDKYQTSGAEFPLNCNRIAPGLYELHPGLIPEGYTPPADTGGITYDEWQRLSNLRFDCNGNGVFDDEEIAQGKVRDENNNGIPDECE